MKIARMINRGFPCPFNHRRLRGQATLPDLRMWLYVRDSPCSRTGNAPVEKTQSYSQVQERRLAPALLPETILRSFATLRLCGETLSHKLIPILQRPLDLHHMPLSFVAMLLTQLDRQRFQQTECDVHRLKVLRLDIRNVTAKRADRGRRAEPSASAARENPDESSLLPAATQLLLLGATLFRHTGLRRAAIAVRCARRRRCADR